MSVHRLPEGKALNFSGLEPMNKRMNVLAEFPAVKPCDHATIVERVKSCPRLPSLRSIETALRELLHADMPARHRPSDDRNYH